MVSAVIQEIKCRKARSYMNQTLTKKVQEEQYDPQTKMNKSNLPGVRAA